MTLPTEHTDGPRAREWWRRRAVPILLVAVVFLSGLVIGGALTPFLIHRFGPAFFPRPSEMPRRLTEEMRRDLDLTDEQTQEIRAVLDREHEKIEALRADVDSRVEQMMDAFRADIIALLTPEQAERWTRRFDEMRRKQPPFGPPLMWEGPGHGHPMPRPDFGGPPPLHEQGREHPQQQRGGHPNRETRQEPHEQVQHPVPPEVQPVEPAHEHRHDEELDRPK